MGGMMGGYGGAIGGLGLLGGLINLVFTIGLLAGLVLLGVWLWRRYASAVTASVGEAQPVTAREILQARYARGEMGREQYQAMLQDLNSRHVRGDARSVR